MIFNENIFSTDMLPAFLLSKSSFVKERGGGGVRLIGVMMFMSRLSF